MLIETRNIATARVAVLTAVVAGLSLSLSGLVFAADSNTADASAKNTGLSQQLYAKVGDAVITLDEYNQSFQRTVRQKFYHSKPPEGELDEVRKAVADELITRQLLLQEAARRGLKPDETAISKTLDKYDQQYASSARWQQQRDVLLKKLQKKLSDEDVLQQLQSQVRNIAPPTDAQLKKYYQENPQKFTEPMQQKLSLILLVVDPSSAKDVWDAAMKEGQSLVKELHQGKDFAGLARLHSGDVSSARGGDMGYIHRDMLSEAAQKVVDELKPGEFSDAVRVLQGVAILRLDDRRSARLREYNDVAERARGLWLRDKSELAWTYLKDKLRLDTPVTVYNKMHNKDDDA
ncbi:MAG: hypothetical protein DRQ44_01030 [Gammaproteobacteria bacterium]|nr:MAG: hypothetical protein DRQ44_01030 [Gammaproteobacteria bacterium]